MAINAAQFYFVMTIECYVFIRYDPICVWRLFFYETLVNHWIAILIWFSSPLATTTE